MHTHRISQQRVVVNLINVLLARPLEPWYCREMSGVTEAIKPYNGKEVAIQGFIVPSLFRVRNARARKAEGRETTMIAYLRAVAIVGGLLIALCSADGALAQKAGGTLKISFFDNPASMSLHEEATGAALRPMMGVFN